MRTFILFAALILLYSCGHNGATLKLEDQPIGEEAYRYLMPEGGKVNHPKHGKEVWFAYGAMSGVGDRAANGVVQGYMFEDGTSAVTMQLNILPAGEDSFYEVWFMSSDGVELVPAGHLVNHFGDARHQLNFETDSDISSLTQVHVTLELDDGNPEKSEKLVAEGVLKMVER